MDPFVGEIRPVVFNYAPQGWLLCDGAVVQISQYNTLFALLGTVYGGNGTTTFGIPDLRGRLPIHAGQGPGLTDRVLGQFDGSETVSLTSATTPAHTHSLQVSSANGDNLTPDNKYPAVTTYKNYYDRNQTPAPLITMSNNAVQNNVQFGVSHNNMMPYMVFCYIICYEGIFPQQS